MTPGKNENDTNWVLYCLLLGHILMMPDLCLSGKKKYNLHFFRKYTQHPLTSISDVANNLSVIKMRLEFF